MEGGKYLQMCIDQCPAENNSSDMLNYFGKPMSLIDMEGDKEGIGKLEK